MSATMLVPAAICTGLILVSFLCTLCESSLRTLSPAEIIRFTTHYPLVARILQRFKDSPLLPQTTIALLHYPSLVLGGIILLQRPVALPSRYILTGGLLYAYLFIFAGILLPRALGTRYREPLAFIFAVPLRIASALLIPFSLPLMSICRHLSTHKKNDPSVITDDIILLTQAAANGTALSRQQAHLITRSIQLSNKTAADIMVERSEMRPIADTCSLTEALIEAHHHHHTRFPLTHEGDLDQIIGYVNFKDIVGALRINPADPTLYGIRRPVETVEAATPLPELLELFTRGRQHIVIVKDTGGKTLGMVTLEDLLETLIGDLEDEYDTPPDFVVQLGENRFCAGGGASFSKLRKKVSTDFPDWDVTVNEWLLGLADGKLQEKYTASYEHYLFTVRKITRGNAFDVIISRKPPTVPETTAGVPSLPR
ncbi:MAG: CBS domain-containing protein [Chitinispirillaceae bacterium]|nr:CBS domain-containing protein [Chitinispirillaceae bacterium]